MQQIDSFYEQIRKNNMQQAKYHIHVGIFDIRRLCIALSKSYTGHILLLCISAEPVSIVYHEMVMIYYV